MRKHDACLYTHTEDTSKAEIERILSLPHMSFAPSIVSFGIAGVEAEPLLTVHELAASPAALESEPFQTSQPVQTSPQILSSPPPPLLSALSTPRPLMHK